MVSRAFALFRQQLEPLAVKEVEGEAEEREGSFFGPKWVFQVENEKIYRILTGLGKYWEHKLIGAAEPLAVNQVEGEKGDGEERVLARAWVLQFRCEPRICLVSLSSLFVLVCSDSSASLFELSGRAANVTAALEAFGGEPDRSGESL